MKQYNYKQAKFFTTVNDLASLPTDFKLEIAICGRSNAGKSTLLNTLCNQVRLAFTSKTPGRTQHINYFDINDAYLVDLPGYGYAKVPPNVKKHWEQLLGKYLTTRKQLIGLILIMDSRHPLKELDLLMLDFFSQTNKPIHIVLSKSDKLNNQEKSNILKHVNTALTEKEYIHTTVQLFSALKRQGINELETVLDKWLNSHLPISLD